jgi:hypothetical protein
VIAHAAIAHAATAAWYDAGQHLIAGAIG